MANNVVFKKGLYRNLPSSADENILFFCTDVGKIFQGAGNGKALIEYGNDVLSGFTDLDDLKAKNPQIQGKLYLTDDNRIYRYDGSEYVLISGGNGSSGVIVDLSDYMKISEYASAINQGSVAKADKALEIDGVKQAQPLMYYGTDNNGNVGFHYIPIDKNTKDGEIEQRVILNASAGVSHIVESKNDMSDGKAFIQAYKFVAGEQNVIKTIKEFNNKDSSNFYYDKNGVVFEDTCHIKNRFDVELKKTNDLYKSNVIKKDDYCKIESILER